MLIRTRSTTRQLSACRQDDIVHGEPSHRDAELPVRAALARSFWWLIGLAVLAGASWIGGLRFNLTRSMPIGLYRITRGLPVRGTVVLVCLPPDIAAFALERGYVPHGGACAHGAMPIGKVVLGVAGDTVTVKPTGLLVNGVPVPTSGALARDHLGRSLPKLPYGPRVLSSGTLWLYSPYNARSFDSRYFGPMATRYVIAVVRPLWTKSMSGAGKS